MPTMQPAASPPPLPAAFLRQLGEALPPERLLTGSADCVAYSYDNSKRIALPQAVAFALSHAEVVSIVSACHQHGVPLTARGRGTNTTGASVPVAGGVVLSLERMSRILRISPGDRLIEVEAGCINGDVQAAAAQYGLFWAPDPTSAGYSTVGGNLACGAGGPRAVKYGTARDNVLGLSAVTGDGRSLKTGAATTKSVVGYDLTRLLIGSEGTLAVITRATLKLLPLPAARRTLRACYADVGSAACAVARIMGQPLTPCALEFMDAEAVRLAEAYQSTGVPAGTQALLLIEVDGNEDTIAHTQRAVADAASGEGMVELKTAASEAEAQALWSCRKALSPSLRKLAPKKVNEDVAVPVTRLPELIAGLTEISARHRLPIVNFGHAGNGNIHVNILADTENTGEMHRIEPCLHEVFRLVLSLEGTLSGEHGIGIEKRGYVGWEVDAETLAQMRGIKRLFDPRGILNPGKSLPAG